MLNILTKFIFLCVLSLSLNANKLSITAYKDINSYKLPPEPDETLNNSTLLGIDRNNNGVRDDVEIWIYETYKDKHPIHIDIAMQAGRAYKQVLETPEKAREIHDFVTAPLDCEAYYKYSAKWHNEPLLIKKTENITNRYFRHKIYFNTKERMKAYKLYDHLLSGGVYSSLTDKEEKAACDFDTTKHEE